MFARILAFVAVNLVTTLIGYAIARRIIKNRFPETTATDLSDLDAKWAALDEAGINPLA